MRVEQSTSHVVKRDNQVVQRHRRVQILILIKQFNRIARGDVLHRDFQLRELFRQVCITGQKLFLAIHHKPMGFAVDH